MRRVEPDRAARAEDEVVAQALALHDEGFSFAQIALALDRPVWWARDVITDVLLEERRQMALN